MAGTVVLLGDGQEQAINTIHVGERVATDGGVANNPDGKTAATNPNSTSVNPKTWRLVTMDVEATTASGGDDLMEVQELMPLSLLRKEHARPGANIPVPLDLGDIGELGYQTSVESIGACPTIQSGPGRVVLTTLTHLNNYVFDLTLRNAAGVNETLGVTGFYKLYTEDKGWNSTANLSLGEKIRGDQGDLTVVSLVQDAGTQWVYNMTVEADHDYYVGGLQALSHNIDDCGEDSSDSDEAAEQPKGNLGDNKSAQKW